MNELTSTAGAAAIGADHSGAEPIVIGCSPRMRAALEFVRIVSASESNVLIVGETGTGKETIATLIHRSGRRRTAPFVAVGCAILTETLIEAELFGHERGAFTGAIRDRAGRFELAHGGTIFLDDIDDVPPAIQVKLLRIVQQRVVERVGGTRAIPVDVRIIAGSKRPLHQMVGESRFRADLYYRLNVLPIWLPPLRDRREDIPLLTDYFVRRFYKSRGERPPELSPAVRQAFRRYAWPGNVRELENACERMAQTCHCECVRAPCLPARILVDAQRPSAAPPDALEPPAGRSLDDRLQEVEVRLITWALRVSHGNKSRAAALLQIKRSTLGDRIRRHGLDRPGTGDAHCAHASSATGPIDVD